MFTYLCIYFYCSGVSISTYTKVYKFAAYVYHCVTVVQTLCMWLGLMFVQGEVATGRLILSRCHPDFSYIINLHTNFNLLNVALLQLWWVTIFILLKAHNSIRCNTYDTKAFLWTQFWLCAVHLLSFKITSKSLWWLYINTDIMFQDITHHPVLDKNGTMKHNIFLIL